MSSWRAPDRLRRLLRGGRTRSQATPTPAADLEAAEAAIAQRIATGQAPSTEQLDRFAAVVLDHPKRGQAATRRVVVLLRNTNRVETAADLCRGLFEQSANPRFGVRLHRLQLRLGDMHGAADTARRVRELTPEDDPTADVLDARAAMRSGRPADAVAALVQTTRVRNVVELEVQARQAIGDHDGALTALAAAGAELGDESRRLATFDSLVATGRTDEARQILVPLADSPSDAVIARVALIDGGAAADRLLNRLAETATGDDLETAGIILFRSNRAEQAITTLRQADAGDGLSGAGRQALANALYSERRFDEALIETDRMANTERHWSAMKLAGRILIQLGRFEAAEENRRAHARRGDSTDQVLYHALLGQHRYEEAFRERPFVDDLRNLRGAFGDTAEAHPRDRVGRRFIVADAGPGDEIQDASVLAELAELSDQVTSTCDPRLTSLLRRSFPDVTFLPTDRWRDPPHLGSHASDAAPRARHALHYLLTEEADAVARTHDRVVLGRAIKNARDLSEGPRPAPPFLVPDPARVASWRGRLAGDEPVIGLVWRSELQTSWRAVHYLRADELQPIAELPARFVCLQHDVSDDELVTLQSMVGDRFVETSDADLRNDFEEMAALVASLDLTIGIGTTIVNLAAAVGCPTLMMQPSHFGSWLATDEEGQDFWYGPCRVMVADPPYDTAMLVRRTAERARLMVQEDADRPD